MKEPGSARRRGRARRPRTPAARPGLAGAEPGRRRACPTAARTTPRCCAPHGEPGPAPARDHAAFAEATWASSRPATPSRPSGSRFVSLCRDGRLPRARARALHARGRRRRGFTPVAPPVLVREETMEEAGFFPTDRAQVYEVDGGELFLVGTSEIPLATLHRGERLNSTRSRPATPAARLLPPRGRHVRPGHPRHLPRPPVRQGRDVRRSPSRRRSDEEFDRIVADPGIARRGLGLPYRVVNIAAGTSAPPRPPRSTTSRRGSPPRAATAR